MERTDDVIQQLLDPTVANIEPPRQGRRINTKSIIKKQKAILLFLSGLVNKSLPIMGRQGKIIQAVIDYYRDPTEEKLKTILYNLVQRIQFETPSLGDTIRFITQSTDYAGVEHYTDQMGGSKDKQKRRKKLRKKRTHKKGKRTQRK
tara:strand:+ start:3445 stop:3885 length:441 start_codon:yes stop_codon:yes gene_type:complete